jgi:hypothetical protein
MTPTFNITTFTAAQVQQALQKDGLDTLGLTTLALSTGWSSTAIAAADYDSNELTLNVSNLHAPWRGILDFAFAPVSSTLSAAITPTATTLSVKSGDGANFPSPSGGPILLTLSSNASTKVEVVECSAHSGDSFTITRGANDTTAQAFASGDKVSLRLSSGTRTDSFFAPSGNALSGACAVLRLHPAAVWRLETLMKNRYTDGVSPLLLPVPWCMVVRGAQGFTSPHWLEPDDALTTTGNPASGTPLSGKISFHDGRGLIVDPIYVASVLADLQQWLAGLTGKTSSTPVAGAGGVQSIAALSTSTVVHLVDLHGKVYQPALPGANIITRTSGGAQSNTFSSPNGLATLAAGETIDTSGGDAKRLRWGWQTNGLLGTAKLTPPALPTTGVPRASLSQQFFRVVAVDTSWALLGNRTNAPVLSIPGDDGTIPADLLPQVRDLVNIDYLADGPDTLATANAVMTRPNQGMILAVSPALDGSMSVPTQAGANAHWPAFPPPNGNAGFPSPPLSPKTGLKAAWTSGFDVVVTVAKDTVPDGAHIRIYQQVYVTIPAITQEPSFVNGDGGAGIAAANTDTQILLVNPFGLSGGSPKPPNLTMDIVVMPRNGQRKLWGAVSVAISPGPVPAPPDPFAGVTVITAMVGTFESIAPSTLFGIPTTVLPPAGPPANVIAFIRSLASEGIPRQGPRLPTMGRLETIIATGTTGNPDGTLQWEAVLTGGRWAREMRSALHASGNPGNPPGPDVHAPGIHITGDLAYDAARHAMKRAQPILPLPGSPGTQLGWIIGMDANNFNAPTDTTATNTGCGAFLETVAAVCETPELSIASPPAPGTTVQTLANNIADALGVPRQSVSATNDVRIIGEVRREIVVSTNGLRDSQWSLRRALREARELIYIESPQFARTARPTGAATAEQVDLVADIVASLKASATLKVIICIPRESDFTTKYKGWSRQHYIARTEAAGLLLSAAPDRVAIFHPVGFPGRTAFVRNTTVIVDDVWCLTGASHFRRRGMTFDGSAAVASFDRQMDNGYSKKVRAFRRLLMAAKLAVAAPGAGSPSADWLRLGRPESAFQLVNDWLQEGGLGFIQPLWPGPSDTSVLPATNDMADPDGSNGSTFLGLFASLIAEAGD